MCPKPPSCPIRHFTRYLLCKWDGQRAPTLRGAHLRLDMIIWMNHNHSSPMACTSQTSCLSDGGIRPHALVYAQFLLASTSPFLAFASLYCNPPLCIESPHSQASMHLSHATSTNVPAYDIEALKRRGCRRSLTKPDIPQNHLMTNKISTASIVPSSQMWSGD